MSVGASFRLDGQAGIITGAAGGIGATLAEGLAIAGANIVVADLAAQRDAAEQTAARVRQAGREALVCELDVTRVDSIEATVAASVAAFGRLDFIVNNAGVHVRKPFLEYTEADWDLMAAVNLKGVFFCAQAAAKQMVRQKRGKIVNMASQLAVAAMADRSIYSIHKAGVAQMARALAVELGPHGITANAVGPTFISTPLTTSMFSDPEFRAANLPRIPSGRFGTAEDVLGAVQYLLSPAGDLVNGHLLLVDGGYTAW